eukprot:PhM_4_TR3453/c0_g1_i1/m.51657
MTFSSSSLRTTLFGLVVFVFCMPSLYSPAREQEQEQELVSKRRAFIENTNNTSMATSSGPVVTTNNNSNITTTPHKKHRLHMKFNRLFALTRNSSSYPTTCPQNLSFYFLPVPDSVRSLVIEVTQNNTNNSHTELSYCSQMHLMSGYCMEHVLMDAIAAHPCRVGEIDKADAVFVESYFIAHLIKLGRAGIRQHLMEILEQLRNLEVFENEAEEEASKAYGHRRFFMYFPMWLRPPPHFPRRDKSLLRDLEAGAVMRPYHFLNILSHNIGIAQERPRHCFKQCAHHNSGSHQMAACLRRRCPKDVHNLVVRGGTSYFKRAGQRHIALPQFEPDAYRETATTPPPWNERSVFLTMSGRWADHVGRVRIHDQIEAYNNNKDKDGDRDRVVQWASTTDNVLEQMRQSVFCIDTQGDSLNTRRTTDAIISGCIPVLVCDDCFYPFDTRLDYPSFTVRVPDASLTSVVKIVLNITNETIRTLQQGVFRERAKFLPPRRAHTPWWVQPAKPTNINKNTNTSSSSSSPSSQMVDEIVLQMRQRVSWLQTGDRRYILEDHAYPLQ